MIQSNSSNKNDSTTRTANSSIDKNKCYLVKGPKPLQKYRFYLDIKNHAVTSKLEQKIKDLGGVVEFFLVREVTHVISDRQECYGSGIASPQTPLSASVESTVPNESPKPETSSRAGQTRLKTRADAMLEKVRSQTITAVRDPLKNAKLWNIPIWTVNKVFSWLEKVSANVVISTNSSNKSKGSKYSVKQFSIRAPYLKFEPITRDARPVYKTIESWPILDFNAIVGKPAFCMKAREKSVEFESIDVNDSNRMTRKGRSRHSLRGGIKDGDEKSHNQEKTILGGYCEICHIEYQELGEHLRSDTHQSFIRNETNYLTLDSLINTSANVEAFLKFNGGLTIKDGLRRSLRNGRSPNGKYNGMDEYCRPTRNKIYNTRYSSNYSAMSPTGSEGGHNLRSRGHLWSPNNFIGNAVEDDICPSKQKESVKHDKKNNKLNDDEKDVKLIKEDDKDVKNKDSPEKKYDKNKKSFIKTKRISADERLVADNRTYYKVEVMTTKLRSSGLGTREHEITRRMQTPVPEENEEKEKSLVVKFKKIRKSELSVLNDEAENFMFPRKEDPSFDDIDTDEGPNTTCSTTKNESVEINSSEIELKTPKSNFKIEHSEDSVEEFLDSSVPLKDRFKCEIEVANRRRNSKRFTDDDCTPKTIRNCTKQDSVVIKRRSTRKCDVETLDDTAQDGSALIENTSRRKRRVEHHIDYADDTEISKDGTSRDSVSVCDSEGRRRKRRTQAEVFIEDNQKYFKFETPGSRLRYQGSIFGTPVKSPIRLNGEREDENDEEEKIDKKTDFSLEKVKYSFEIEPKTEPWYQTFVRQDIGEEYYTSLSEPGYQTRLILPYQIPGYLPPLDPKICMSKYDRIRNCILDPDTDEVQNEDSTNCSEQSEQTSSSNQQNDDQPPRRRRKRKSKFLIKSNHPRKSPRQHASTLAILSSLLHQRKKRERKSERESDVSRSSLPSIPEENTPVIDTPRVVEQDRTLDLNFDVEDNTDISAATQIISEILSAPLIDLDISEETDGICINDKPDAIELLQNYENVFKEERYNNQTITTTQRVKKIRRKRKKNRTGWPQKKKLFPRRSGIKTDTIPEPEDSRGSLDDNNELDNLKDSDAEDVLNECEGSDVENRTRSVLDSINNDSVDSNCNINDGDIKMESSELCKTKSELDNMINDNSDDILVVYGNLKQGVSQSIASKKELNLINRLTEKINCALDKSESENQTNLANNSSVANKGVESRLDNQVEMTETPGKKEQRNSSSDCSAEEVIPSNEDKVDDSVNVDLNTWENAEKVLHAKMVDNEKVTNKKILQCQPFVRVQKIDNKIQANRRLRSSSSPDRKPKKRAKLTAPISPRSPRKLRAPRGKWYRER